MDDSAQQVIKHDQGFTAKDDEGFPGGSALPAVVGEGLGEAVGVVMEGHGHEIEDMAEQGVAPFGEAAAALEVAGLVEGHVQAGVSDEGFGGREALEVADEGEEEGGKARADAGNSDEDLPGLRIALADGLAQEGEALGAQVFEEGPAVKEELQRLGADGVMEAERSAGQGLEGRHVEAMAGREDLGEFFGGRLGDGLGGGEVTEEATEGFGEAGVGPFQFGEEKVEELTDLILGTGEFLSQVLVKVGEGAQGGVVLQGGRQGLDGELLAEEEGEGAGVQAVGFGAAAGARLGEVTDLGGGEAVEGEIGALEAEEVGLQEGRVGPGSFQAHPPVVGLKGVPGGQEVLPAGAVVGKGLDVLVQDLARKGGDDEESDSERVLTHVDADEPLTLHRFPPSVRWSLAVAVGQGLKGGGRKGSGPPRPNLPLHGGSQTQATHRGCGEAGGALLEGLSGPLS